MQEIQINEYHPHDFVRRIIELTKEGWEIKSYESSDSIPQWLGTALYTVMTKEESSVVKEATSVAETSTEKQTAVRRRAKE